MLESLNSSLHPTQSQVLVLYDERLLTRHMLPFAFTLRPDIGEAIGATYIGILVLSLFQQTARHNTYIAVVLNSCVRRDSPAWFLRRESCPEDCRLHWSSTVRRAVTVLF